MGGVPIVIVHLLTPFLLVSGWQSFGSNTDPAGISPNNNPIAEGSSATQRRLFPRKSTAHLAASDSKLSTPSKWVVEGETPGSGFARCVGPVGDADGDGLADVFITEWEFDHGRGRVLVFRGTPAGLNPTPNWILTGIQQPEERLGEWAESAGDVDGDGFDDLVVVGAAPEGVSLGYPAAPTQVLLFSGSASGPVLQTNWLASSSGLGVKRLFTAGRAGDLNGDGYDDLYAVGWVGEREGKLFRVFTFHGGPAGLNSNPAASWDIGNPFSAGMPSVACAGDVNHDGFDDLIVGSAWWSGSAKSAGRVYVHHGSRSGVDPKPAWTSSYPQPAKRPYDDANETFFGWSIGPAGDVNNDGFADIVIGAPYADHEDINEGLAFAYHGSGLGLSRQPDWRIESNRAHTLLGYSVRTAGDVNGDGFGDVIVGVPYATDGQYNEGAALVFLGSKEGLSRSPHWVVESDNTLQYMGQGVANAGDVNGDGYDDVLVVSRDYLRQGDLNQKVGRVYLFYGTASGLPHSAEWSLKKPLLAAAQQRLERLSPAWKLSGFAALFASSLILFVAWRRAVAKWRTAERETARVLERERLSRDLHDELGASLARLALLEDNAVSSERGSVSEHVQAALRSTEQIVWAVNPANDTLENLVAFLLVQADRIFKGTGVRCITEAPLDLPARGLEPDFRKNLFLATKEALTNTLKHARPKQVRLVVAFTDPILAITIQDDGVGVSPDSERRFGNGLKNMRQRMKSLGGSFEIGSGTGSGTRVVFRVSVPGSAQPAWYTAKLD
jgi:signal transduction histidine kinase